MDSVVLTIGKSIEFHYVEQYGGNNLAKVFMYDLKRDMALKTLRINKVNDYNSLVALCVKEYDLKYREENMFSNKGSL